MSHFRNKDNSSRHILNKTLIDNKYKMTDNRNNLKEVLYDAEYLKPLDLKQFEISTINGANKEEIINIINRFYLSLDHPRYIKRIKFDDYQANELSERIKSLSYHIYGDREYYYIIQYLNNINHPSELSKNSLMNKGVLILTGEGLEKLNSIINFIKAKDISRHKDGDILAL